MHTSSVVYWLILPNTDYCSALKVYLLSVAGWFRRLMVAGWFRMGEKGFRTKVVKKRTAGIERLLILRIWRESKDS